MIEFAARVMEYTNGLDQAQFVERAITYDATLRNRELISEAATRIRQSVRDAAAKTPRRRIVATRNRLAHAYLGIDNDTLRSSIRDDVPALAKALRQLRDDWPDCWPLEASDSRRRKRKRSDL